MARSRLTCRAKAIASIFSAKTTFRASRVTKQSAKPLLLEMAVVGECSCDAEAAHRVHRNAIGQTVALVGAHSIQIQPTNKRFPALGNHSIGGIPDELGNIASGPGADGGTGTGKKSQILSQHLIGRYNSFGTQGTAEFEGAMMRRIVFIGQCGPIKRIGKDSFHGSLFGQP